MSSEQVRSYGVRMGAVPPPHKICPQPLPPYERSEEWPQISCEYAHNPD